MLLPLRAMPVVHRWILVSVLISRQRENHSTSHWQRGWYSAPLERESVGLSDLTVHLPEHTQASPCPVYTLKQDRERTEMTDETAVEYAACNLGVWGQKGRITCFSTKDTKGRRELVFAF